MKTSKYTIGVFLFMLSILAAQDNNSYPKRTHFATKLSTVAPLIDGNLNDPAWQTVAWADSFVQLNPIEGDPPSEHTQFKVLYGPKSIFFAVMSYDSEPDKMTARLSRRDDVEDSDFIAIGLDSYFDKRTGFVLA